MDWLVEQVKRIVDGIPGFFMNVAFYKDSVRQIAKIAIETKQIPGKEIKENND